MAPSAAPAPTTVCSSSMKRTTWPSESLISLSTALRRSSNSPRNLAPAMSAPRSSATTRRSREALGHVAAHDALGEALDDGGLAHAGLADEHGVVLGAPAEHLDDATDLLVAADDRVELALARRRREVLAVLLEGLVGGLRVGRGDALAAAHGLQGAQQGLVAGAGAFQESLRLATGLRGRQQQVLGGDVLVAEPSCLVLGALDERASARVQRELPALDPGAARECRSQLHLQAGGVGAELAQGHGRDALGVGRAGRPGCARRRARGSPPAWPAAGRRGWPPGPSGCSGRASWGSSLTSAGAAVARLRMGLGDVVDEGLGQASALLVKVGGQDDVGAHPQVAATAAAPTGQALAGEAEEAAVLGPGRDGQLQPAAHRGTRR